MKQMETRSRTTEATMRKLKTFALGVVSLLATAALIQPADATTFRWSQHGGFVLDASATLQRGEGPEALAGAGIPGNPPRAGLGGLEFFDPQAAPAPASTYRVVGWGCTPDGNNTVGIASAATTCANAGVAAAAASANDPLASALGARSALELTVFDSLGNGVLNSDTQNVVVIARIDHFNRVIDNEANSLFNINISANLLVKEDNVGEALIVSDANTVPISFRESLNRTTGEASCDGANPLGSICDDVFTFDTSQFANVPFMFNGEDFFLQFGLAPVPECDTPAGTIGTIQIFQCDDFVAHKIAIDFQNGLAWAAEGFDNAFLVTMFVTEERINVPAPAGLALLGLGLVGFGFGAWRKRKTAV